MGGGGGLVRLAARDPSRGGVGIGVVWTASTDLIGGLVGTADRASAIRVFVTSAPGGFAIGQMTATWLTAGAGWPANFVLAAAAAVGSLALLGVGVRDLDVATVAVTDSVLENLATVGGPAGRGLRLGPGVRRVLRVPLPQ